MQRRLALTVLALCLCALPSRASAQGGPPMITDDPGTPGPGHWENNLAVALEHRPGESAFDLPGVDLNYGVGDHIQLTLQSSLAVLSRSGTSAIAGLGDVEAAVKWRFLDEERAGVAVSMFPRVIFSVLASSVQRGLADPGKRAQLPLQVARRFGRFGADAEAGPFYSTAEGPGWLYGLVGGVDLLEGTSLMLELHGNAAVNLTDDVLLVNAGFRRVLAEHAILIGSVGHEVRAPAGETLALIAYLGLQLVW